MAVGYTTEGSVCRQVGHLDVLPQHGVQINRDYNGKKGHPRDVTETLPFSFLKKSNSNNQKPAGTSHTCQNKGTPQCAFSGLIP